MENSLQYQKYFASFPDSFLNYNINLSKIGCES